MAPRHAARATVTVVLLLCGCEGEIVLPPAPTQQPGPGPQACTAAPSKTSARRLTPVQYANAVKSIFEGALPPSARYPDGYGSGATGFSTEPNLFDVGEQTVTRLQSAAEDVAVEFGNALPTLLPCATDAAAGKSCVEEFLARYGRRAFRRALTADEVAAFQAADDAAIALELDFRGRAASLVSQLLQSPQFLYQVEDSAPAARAVTDDELASRLAFTLWDSVPDEALLALAQQGLLSQPAVLQAQAQRMLEATQAEPALTRFFREWMQVGTLAGGDRDSTLFPFFTDAYGASLDASFTRQVLSQVRGGGTFQSLLGGSGLEVDSAMAQALGLPAVAPGQWARVNRPGGLAVHPLVLANGAHPTESAFILRGKRVRQRLLCEVSGAVPANAQAEASTLQLPANPTARERAQAIEARPACAGCHVLLNPAGLAYEGYDAVGNPRTAYASGRAIDTAVVLPLGAGSVQAADPGELGARLAQEPQAQTCLARQLYRFTFSMADAPEDACGLQGVTQVLRSGGTLEAAVLAMVTSPAFTRRSDP